MTDIKLALASVLAAGMLSTAMIQLGRGYRTTSDVQLRSIEVGGPSAPPGSPATPNVNSVRPPARSRQATSGDAAPPAGKGSAPPAAPPGKTKPSPAKVKPTPPPPPVFTIERDVYYTSTDDYADGYDEEPDENE